MRSDARAPERGFTLLEIVCTLVILGVLGSLVRAEAAPEPAAPSGLGQAEPK